MSQRPALESSSWQSWEKLSGKLVIAALLLTSAFLLYVAYQNREFLNDDSYIGLTYARNLATGKGFAYNHASPTLGTTTPLYVLIVAGLGWLFPGLGVDTMAVFFTMSCWIGVVWIFYLFRITWGLQDWQAGIVGIVAASSVWVGALGMEAYLFSFLLILCLSLFFSRQHWLAGLTTGLLFLTRGEGSLILCLLLTLATVQDWRQRRSLDIRVFKPAICLGLGFAVPIFLWFIYAQLTFGTFLPNTLAAKQAQKQTRLWLPFFRQLIENWLPRWGSNFTIPQLPARTLWWSLVVIGVFSAMRQRRQWLALLGWIALYITGYSLLGVAAYAWYQVPILFVLQLFLALGIIQCVVTLRNRVKPAGVAVGLSTVFALVVLLNLTVPAVSRSLSHPGDPRGPSYVALTQWLRTNTASGESVAFIEVGYLGYYTDNRIIDLAGLVLPEIVPHVAKGDFAWGFWHYAPDYYIYSTEFNWVVGSITDNPEFKRSYTPIATFPGPRQTNLVVYKHTAKGQVASRPSPTGSELNPIK